MMWTICFAGSVLIAIAAVVAAILLGAGKYRRGRVVMPFHILFGGVLLAVFCCLLPIYHTVLAGDSFRFLKTALLSLHSTFQIFTMDADHSLILEHIACPDARLAALYSAGLSVAFVLAPVLTFGFLISFFKNLSAYFKYLLHYFNDAYIFSELNEKSLALGADLKKNHPHAVIVYTDVFENNSETTYELIGRARDLRALCFKKDIAAIRFQRHYGKAAISLFAIGADEAENIEQALQLIHAFRERERTNLFVFSTGIESELLLTRAEKGRIKVRRINEVRSLINRILYEDGHKIFEHAIPIDGQKRQITAVLVGLGRYGTEMLKALSWYCQMDGYRACIEAFDADPLAEERFTALAPELMSERYNGVAVPGEAEYTIRIHSGVDVTTQSFAEEIMKQRDATYVLVSLGDDERNIRAAVDLRMRFERLGIKPVIQAIVYSSEKRRALAGIVNYRGQPYEIDFIGDIGSSCSEAVLLNSEVEEDALQRHLKWDRTGGESFWEFEYNYRSSVASAIHGKARRECGLPGAGKREEELTPEERNVLEAVEHRRWNAYMRSEGYVYSGSHDAASRNDLGKMHHDLVCFDELDEEEKRKDSRVGSG